MITCDMARANSHSSTVVLIRNCSLPEFNGIYCRISDYEHLKEKLDKAIKFITRVANTNTNEIYNDLDVYADEILNELSGNSSQLTVEVHE